MSWLLRAGAVTAALVLCHFAALVIDLPLSLRPLTYVKHAGDFVAWGYARIGDGVGYLWYLTMVAATEVRAFFDVVWRRLWPSLTQTFWDLCDSISGFFKIRDFFLAVFDQVFDFWITHTETITQGYFILGFIITAIGFGTTFFFVRRYERQQEEEQRKAGGRPRSRSVVIVAKE